MFNVEVNEGSNQTIKLLANIQALLIEQNTLLQGFSSASNEIVHKVENKANIDVMERKELLAIIKTLPKGSIKGKYITMNVEELRKQVKEAI